MRRRQNQLLMLGRKIQVIAFWGGPIAFHGFAQIYMFYRFIMTLDPYWNLFWTSTTMNQTHPGLPFSIPVGVRDVCSVRILLTARRWAIAALSETLFPSLALCLEVRTLLLQLRFRQWRSVTQVHHVSIKNVLLCLLSLQLPKVVREWCVLYILTSTCASRDNGVHFFDISTASWLRTRRFSEPTFRPRSPKSLEKHSVSRLSYLFTHLHLLSSYSFLSSNLSLLSASSLLCFSSVHIVGSLTSKLPSVIYAHLCASLQMPKDARETHSE